MTTAALEALDISKSYPGVRALDGVSLQLLPGEIHAVMGENGSGKSTLLSILSGAQRPDGGTITVGGGSRDALDPRTARELGVAIVHQEPELSSSLSVGENVKLGRVPTQRGLVSWRRTHREAQRVLDTLGVDLSSRTRVADLSTGRRQLVEIAKGLVDLPRVLLLDEATSSLDDADVAALFALLRRLRDQGVAIAFISHKMKEVMDLADRATVLRDGTYVGTDLIEETDERRLVSMMVGRDLESYWHKADVEPGDTLLSVQGLTRGVLQEVSLHVRTGEVVGLAGLVGSGRSALMRTLMGVRRVESGTIAVSGREVSISSPRKAHRLGLGYVPEDRKSEGLVMGWSIARNAGLAAMNDRPHLAPLTDRFDRAALARGSTGLTLKARNHTQRVRELSGGNQQKVVLARELATAPRLLLLDEPTRGVDVGAKEDIYAEIAQLVGGGMGVLLASSELPELLGICDRIYVFFRGRIVGEFDARTVTEEEIAFHASGAHEVSPAASREDQQ